jgi:AhpD family alkylhydroperoxidase
MSSITAKGRALLITVKEVMFMENQLELNNGRRELLTKFSEAMPEFRTAESKLKAVVYKDGALSTKLKRLIALGIAIREGCTYCILAQTMRALNDGATKQEILETLQVAIYMGCSMGNGESFRVIKIFDELGENLEKFKKSMA